MQLARGELNEANSTKKEISIQFSPTKNNEKLCRICLQQLEEDQIPELCLCKGENSYIHEKCLLEWVKRADKYEQFPYMYFYLCDLCRTRIYLETEIKWSCKKWENITFFGRSTGCTILSIFVLIVGLILIVEGVILVQTSDLKELVWFGLIAGCIVLILGLVFYTFQVLLDMEIIIHGLAKKTIKTAKKNQVMPTNPEVCVMPFETTDTLPAPTQTSHNHLRDYQH